MYKKRTLYTIVITILPLLVQAHWQYTSIPNTHIDNTIRRLNYQSSDPCSLSLEIIQYGVKTHGYLLINNSTLIHSLSSTHTTLSITTTTESKNFPIQMLEGSQKATLNKECLNYIINQCLNKNSIRISIEKFSQTINNQKFKNKYKTFNKLSPKNRSNKKILDCNLLDCCYNKK